MSENQRANENAEGWGRKHKEAVSLPTLGCEEGGKFLGKWLERSTCFKSITTIKCATMYITKSQPSLCKRGKKGDGIRNQKQREERKSSNWRVPSKSGELVDMASCQTQLSLDVQVKKWRMGRIVHRAHQLQHIWVGALHGAETQSWPPAPSARDRETVAAGQQQRC